MRCKHDVLRNGYWTGKRCTREATYMVTMHAETEDVRPMCTQHANQETSNPASKRTKERIDNDDQG